MPVFFKESLDRDILLPGFTLPFGVPQWPPYLCFITRYSTFWQCRRKTMNPAATTSLFAAILKQGQGQLLPPLDRTRLGECYFLLYTSATDCLLLSYYFLFPFSLRNAVNIVQPIFLQSWKFHLNGVVSTRTHTTHTHTHTVTNILTLPDTLLHGNIWICTCPPMYWNTQQNPSTNFKTKHYFMVHTWDGKPLIKWMHFVTEKCKHSNLG